MTVSKTGTVRFGKVVEAIGKPEIVALWTKPERDKRFMAAARQNRVMTIKQETVGSVKDFGTVGFLREKNVSYLVFPKPLKEFEGRRIVGIQYDLIETPEPIGRIIKPEPAPKTHHQRKTRSPEWEPEPKRLTKEISSAKGTKIFTATIRFIATADVLEKVKAGSNKEAKELALKQADMPDFRRATVTRKIVKLAE
jgi:hypothetical protein